jgi:hypothetical protein
MQTVGTKTQSDHSFGVSWHGTRASGDRSDAKHCLRLVNNVEDIFDVNFFEVQSVFEAFLDLVIVYEEKIRCWVILQVKSSFEEDVMRIQNVFTHVLQERIANQLQLR